MGKIIFGKNTVFDAINNKVPLKVIYTMHQISAEGIKVIKKSSKELSEMVSGNHQGYVAELKEFSFFPIESISKYQPKTVVILDHIQDPHNFGAIIRSMNAFGINYLIIPKDRQADVTPTVLKVSSGGFVGMKIIKVTNISRTISFLKKEGYWIYGSNIGGNSKNIKDVSFSDKRVIVIGNEGKGISNNVLKTCDELFWIPTEGSVQSLNASVASSIIFYVLNNK